MHSYIPLIEAERKEMLSKIGVGDINDLFADIPEEIRLKRSLDLPAPLSELELSRYMSELAEKNLAASFAVPCFLGAGIYDHYIPAHVDQLIMREEFYTAYTPYQAEISQGTLQAIFEYQTLISNLTGMDVSNASMYDGASSLAEAMIMACAITGKQKVLISAAVHPDYIAVCKTYAHFRDIEVVEVPYDKATGKTMAMEADAETAGVILQSPNYFGIIEDTAKIAEGKSKALFIAVCDPISLALLKTPGEYGADIVVGEGQCLGNTMNYGGPGFGFFACTTACLRKMPGRIVGQTADKEGRRGFVMTLQAREQHIRRDKATSNICSNHALNALMATIYLTSLGAKGLREAASLSVNKAHYLEGKLLETGLFERAYSADFFKEFVLEYKGKKPLSALNHFLAEHEIIGGLALEDNQYMIAVTEKRTKADMDAFVKLIEEGEKL